MKDKVFREVDALKRKDGVETFADLLQNVSSVLPPLATLLASLFGGSFVERRLQRFADVMMKLAIEINRLGRGFEEYVGSEGFKDILYRTMLRVDQEGLKEKRELYGTFLKNAVANKLSYDEYSRARLSRFLEDLLPADVAVLSVFDLPDEDSKHPLPIQTRVERATGLVESQIIEVVENLYRVGLVTIDRSGLKAPLTGAGGQYATHRGITPLGKDLLRYLL
jgi:hypothetical protein